MRTIKRLVTMPSGCRANLHNGKLTISHPKWQAPLALVAGPFEDDVRLALRAPVHHLGDDFMIQRGLQARTAFWRTLYAWAQTTDGGFRFVDRRYDPVLTLAPPELARACPPGKSRTCENWNYFYSDGFLPGDTMRALAALFHARPDIVRIVETHALLAVCKNHHGTNLITMSGWRSAADDWLGKTVATTT